MSDGAAFVGTAVELAKAEAALTRRPKHLTPAKARRAVDAILACLECEDVDGTDRVALEDARAALASFEDD